MELKTFYPYFDFEKLSPAPIQAGLQLHNFIFQMHKVPSLVVLINNMNYYYSSIKYSVYFSDIL